MKTLIFVLIATFLSLSLLSVAWVLHQEQSTNLRLIEAEKKALRIERDRLEADYKIRGDSLQIAFETIRQANIVTAKAHEETKAYRKKFESVRFVKFENDSQRVEAIKKLYPSWK